MKPIYLLALLRFAVVVLLALAAAGCGRTPPPPHAALPKANDRQLIRQTVFLSLIEELSTDRKPQPIFFLVLEPEEERSLAVAYGGVRVRNASDCIVDQVQGVKDKNSGEPGLLLEVKQLTIRGDEAEVFAGYFSGGGVLFSFQLGKKNGAWIVLEKKRRLING